MKRTILTDITQDIAKNILSNYFNKSQVKEFKGIVSRLYQTGEKSKKESTPLKKQKLIPNYQENISPLYVDLLITFAADKLIKEKLIELMLYLGEALVAHGELEIATQIYNQILIKINHENNLENIAAYTLLALGEINTPPG